MFTCGRCEKEGDESDFYWSKGKPNLSWCKACFREWHRSRYRPEVLGVEIVDRTCKVCGRTYRPQARRSVLQFCSRRCKDNARNAVTAAERLTGKTLRPCLHCGVVIGPDRRSDARYCSQRCNSAAHQMARKHARRAGLPRRAGDLVSRLEVADRSGWRCGLCGKTIRRTLEYPDPRCLSVDHVVPLSEGGTSDLANLQAAHLVCNLRKGAQPRGEQLRML